MTSEIPWMDIGITVLILFSALVGFARGATREILGLLSWGGALAIALYAGPFLRPFLAPHISSTLVVEVLSGAILFFVALLVLVLLSKAISHHIKGSLLAGLDRSFGFLFGIFRGAFLVVLAYIALTFFLKPNMWPKSLVDSKLLPFGAQGARILLDILPNSDLPNALRHNLPPEVFHTSQELLTTLSVLAPHMETPSSESAPPPPSLP